MPWTVRYPSYCQSPPSILSLLPNSIDIVDLISAAEFLTVPLCHPNIVLSSLGQSSPRSQFSSAYCCTSCCVLPHIYSADFRYCYTSCHPVATIQQCSSLALPLTDFNPVTQCLLVFFDNFCNHELIKGRHHQNLHYSLK